MSAAPAVVLTGAHGFLGWHLSCLLRAVHGIEPVRLGREEMGDADSLAAIVTGADVVVHVAGVNRADSDQAIEHGNLELAETLAAALKRREEPVDVVFANSIQADVDSPYGRGKAGSSAILREAVRSAGGRYADVLLPNLFGEHGRPLYNSFVATFADAVAQGREPTVTDDREIPLLHAQAAAGLLAEIALGDSDGEHRPTGEPHAISEVLARLTSMHELYAGGEVPPLTTPFEVDLFNTYRSYRFPEMFPFSPQVHSDDRGDLFETLRAHGGTGQSFVSTTVPGATRGDHYHLRKVERFFVVKGEAEIALRRLLHDDVVTFRVGGSSPAFVDMPTLWVHNITNVGDDELVTMFWSDQLLDTDDPDQYPERVRPEAA